MAAVDPNMTAVAPEKVVPMITTVVPPPDEPVFGVTDDTIGAAT